MCHIWNCIGWTLDLIQRILTFGLACIMCCAICIGVTTCIMAGIAYGYNYSVSEFLTFSKSDVTVYVRRGQFNEKAELPFMYRRSGGGEADVDEAFTSNSSSDYENPGDVQAEAKELSGTWKLAHDTKNYAEKLTKFGTDVQNARRYNIDASMEEKIEEPNNIVNDVTATETEPLFVKPIDHFKAPVRTSQEPDYVPTVNNTVERNKGYHGIGELIASRGVVDIDDKQKENERLGKKTHKHKHKNRHKKIYLDPEDDDEYEEVSRAFKPL